ncbi:hypothetical protein DGMP_24280 [Desulfomarina profundi]|uniref:Uncharacterized protein n=1 Tax=Desulfomarina profundi TaxID=2772557 RepID=A0A8D5FJ47_9BACT|nr:hypothetical protein [Desulfomarina profundi]BCL61735.1 hypothetical protein DGMP_24280 [Desulfomarina profundi]
MKIYLNRSLGYLFLSLFIALAFGPYDGNPFSKPYQYNSLDNHISGEERDVGPTAKDMEWIPKEFQKKMAELKQRTKKMTAAHIKMMQELEKERRQEENSPKFIKEAQLKRRVQTIRYILAAVFLLPSLTLIRRGYTKQPGIPINPRWVAITADMVFILFLSIMAYCVVAYGWNKFTGTTPYLYDPVAMMTATVVYIPVIIFCAYFTSNLSAQSVEIGDEGIRVHYPANVLFAAWKSIQDFDLKETYTVAGASKFKAPRKLQTKLVIHTNHGDMDLFEPGLKKTKSALINKLKNNAPQCLQEKIEKLMTW